MSTHVHILNPDEEKSSYSHTFHHYLTQSRDGGETAEYVEDNRGKQKGRQVKGRTPPKSIALGKGFKRGHKWEKSETEKETQNS